MKFSFDYNINYNAEVTPVTVHCTCTLSDIGTLTIKKIERRGVNLTDILNECYAPKLVDAIYEEAEKEAIGYAHDAGVDMKITVKELAD